MRKTFGRAPNGEYILDPEGRLVRKRFWSDPRTLREDLSELIGPVANPTRVADVDVGFKIETRTIASGVVPRVKLPGQMVPLIIEPIASDGKVPFYVKLRAEMTPELGRDGVGKLYLGFHLDPLYKVHWKVLTWMRKLILIREHF